MGEEMKYRQAEEYICGIQKFARKNTNAHTRAYLQLLGNPCQNLKIIHVAGTNGKGSVCNYLNCLLMEHGYHTAMFVSPHLIYMRERMLLDNQMVSEEQFLEAYEQVRETVKQQEGKDGWYHPTFFEYLFLMAMVIFHKASPDYIILETGMGGRLDATNVFDNPVLTIITEIGLDHCQYLGDTKAQIAAEKAGIIKEGVPVVYVDRQKEVSEVLSQAAKLKNSPAYAVDRTRICNVNITDKSIDFSYKSRYYNSIGCTLSTTAGYQLENAAVALEAYEVLFDREEISPDKLCKALAKAFWPGRMEQLAEGVYVDGAHNEDGIEAFIDSLKRMPAQVRRVLLFSVVSDKEYETMISRVETSGLFDEYIVAGIGDARGLSGEQISVHFHKTPVSRIHICKNIKEAYNMGVMLKGDGVLYIAGSLYLVGEVKALLKEEKQ